MDKDLFRSRIRLRHLDCFVAVAQERNLGKAAVRLRLTQPAVSKTLAELEEIVGVRLLERSRQGAHLTRDGDNFLAHALPVLEALDAARNAMDRRKAPHQETLRVGALPTVATDLLPPAVAALRRAHPHVRLAIHTAANAALLQMLKGGEVDLVLGRMAEPQMMLGLAFELLYAEPLALAVRPGHPLAALASPSLKRVVSCPAVVSTPGTVPRHNTESLLRAHGLKLPVDCTETLSVSVARRICMESDAVWFTPAGAARVDIETGLLARLAISTKGTEEPVGLMRRTEGLMPALAEEFIRILRREAAARTPQ
jgi:DNA-binding transcriptional LysR family regulator